MYPTKKQGKSVKIQHICDNTIISEESLGSDIGYKLNDISDYTFTTNREGYHIDCDKPFHLEISSVKEAYRLTKTEEAFRVVVGRAVKRNPRKQS